MLLSIILPVLHVIILPVLHAIILPVLHILCSLGLSLPSYQKYIVKVKEPFDQNKARGE